MITITTPTAAPAASPASDQPQTLHVALHVAGNSLYVPVGSLTHCTNTTSCQGDYRLGVVPLVDAATNGYVGTLVYVEFVVDTGDSLFHSPGNAIRLAGRGKIAFTETLYDDGSGRPATAPITGGTGERLRRRALSSHVLPTGGDFGTAIHSPSGRHQPGAECDPAGHGVARPGERPPTVRLTEARPMSTASRLAHSPTAPLNVLQGDYLLGGSQMADPATGNEVGTVTFECFFLDTGSLLLHCPGSGSP